MGARGRRQEAGARSRGTTEIGRSSVRALTQVTPRDSGASTQEFNADGGVQLDRMTWHRDSANACWHAKLKMAAPASCKITALLLKSALLTRAEIKLALASIKRTER